MARNRSQFQPGRPGDPSGDPLPDGAPVPRSDRAVGLPPVGSSDRRRRQRSLHVGPRKIYQSNA